MLEWSKRHQWGGVTPAATQYRDLWGHMSIFTHIFGAKKPDTRTTIEITGRPATFAAFTGDPWANDLYRAGVDAIARICAKFALQPTITFSDGTKANADDRLARLLQVEPNPYMSAYDALYKSYVHLYTANNAFSYLQRDGAGRIIAIWPLHVTSCELAQGADGRTLAALTFANGRTSVLDYGNLVHVRRHFNQGDVMGDSNEAIAPGVELADAQNKGITASIRTSGNIRGIVKYTSTLGPSKLEEYRRHFEETQLRPDNGGVIITDQALEFVPVNDTPATINAQDVEQTKRKIYAYLGISEAIVSSSFDDDGFGAFDESVIEALALQFGLELTRKCYSPAQVARGRRIECQTSRIRYIGTANRTALIEKAIPMGLLTINEGRDILGLAPIEGGERRIQSLNYASTELVDRYQLYNSGRGGVRTMGLPEEADSEEV